MEQPMTTKADASMSPYERYEDELVTLLQMPGVDVKPLPKIEALELPRQTEKPQIFVLVNGTEFAEREELAVVAQLGTVQCELFIRAKNRRGKLGLFDVYEAAKSRLLGHRMLGAKTTIILIVSAMFRACTTIGNMRLHFHLQPILSKQTAPIVCRRSRKSKTNLLKNEKVRGSKSLRCFQR